MTFGCVSHPQSTEHTARHSVDWRISLIDLLTFWLNNLLIELVWWNGWFNSLIDSFIINVWLTGWFNSLINSWIIKAREVSWVPQGNQTFFRTHLLPFFIIEKVIGLSDTLQVLKSGSMIALQPKSRSWSSMLVATLYWGDFLTIRSWYRDASIMGKAWSVFWRLDPCQGTNQLDTNKLYVLFVLLHPLQFSIWSVCESLRFVILGCSDSYT